MNKSDLIELLAQKAKIPHEQSEKIIEAIFSSMANALIQDKRIEIRGFGSFVSKYYKARLGRNPRTGERIEVPPKRLPFFKVGKELRERVNHSLL